MKEGVAEDERVGLEVEDAAGNITTYVYNALGQQSSVKTQLGHLTSYSYDNLGHLLTETTATNNEGAPYCP